MGVRCAIALLPSPSPARSSTVRRRGEGLGGEVSLGRVVRLRPSRPPPIPPSYALLRYDRTMAICRVSRSRTAIGPLGSNRHTKIYATCVRVSPQIAYAILIRYANCVCRCHPYACRPHGRCAPTDPIGFSPLSMRVTAFQMRAPWRGVGGEVGFGEGLFGRCMRPDATGRSPRVSFRRWGFPTGPAPARQQPARRSAWCARPRRPTQRRGQALPSCTRGRAPGQFR